MRGFNDWRTRDLQATLSNILGLILDFCDWSNRIFQWFLFNLPRVSLVWVPLIWLLWTFWAGCQRKCPLGWWKAWFEIVGVDHPLWMTLSRFVILLVDTVANIRQCFCNRPRTTLRFEEFLSSRPGPVSVQCTWSPTWNRCPWHLVS